MAATEGMETCAARLASFDITHPQPRRRASNTKTSKALKWPHKSPSPAQLAKAGFYYKPTVSEPDNVMCFHCQISLDGWEEDDDPATEHLKHSHLCGWAINVCIEKRVEDEDRVEENPLSEEMMNARRSTFADSWPHEHKKGWTCKIEKMVEAGWYYCPTPESDDFVTCAYCNLGLDGWEPKDNPFDEHQRRSPSCLFFAMTANQPTKAPRTRKGRASKASRVSKASSTSTKRTSDQMDTEIKPPPPKKRMTRGTSTIRKASAASTASLRSRIPADSPEEDAPKSSPPPPPEDLPALAKSPSPQSSDAENKPPRLDSGTFRPYMDMFSPLRNPPPPSSSPLAARTPSRHNIIAGGLRSAAPWSAVDLETVFDAGLHGGGKGFSAELTTPEKAMTVEEWIFHNAAAGEERLRGECERVVGVFEAQGLRALRALGGVECA